MKWRCDSRATHSFLPDDAVAPHNVGPVPSSIQYLAHKWRAIFGPVVAVLIGAHVGHLWHADSCRLWHFYGPILAIFGMP